MATGRNLLFSLKAMEGAFEGCEQRKNKNPPACGVACTLGQESQGRVWGDPCGGPTRDVAGLDHRVATRWKRWERW